MRDMIDEVIANNPAVVGLQMDVSVLKQDMFTVKEEQHRQGLMLEDVQSNVQRMLETLTPILKRGELVASHDIVIEQQLRDRDRFCKTKALSARPSLMIGPRYRV